MWFPADLIFHWICNMPNFEAIVIIIFLGGGGMNIIKVIRGQWQSAWVQSFYLKLAWTYFLRNTAVLSFHLEVNSGSWEVIWTAKGLSHIMSFGGQHFLNTSCICSKTQSLRSSKVNLGQPEVSHLTSHLSEHVFIVILLSLAFNWYATCLYSVDFQFFIFQGPKRSREVKSWSWEVIW